MSKLSNKPTRVRYGKELLAEEGNIYVATVDGLRWEIKDVIEGTVVTVGKENNVFRRNKAVKDALINLGVRFADEIRHTKAELEDRKIREAEEVQAEEIVLPTGLQGV